MHVRKWLSSWVLAAITCVLVPVGALAAVDVNTADQAALEGVKGLGPAMSSRIITERGKGHFRDWSDLSTRVSGLGDRNTANLSRNGLVVDGKSKPDAPAVADDSAKSAKSDGNARKAPAKAPRPKEG